MIEYIYDTIQVSQGEPNTVQARITEEDGSDVTTGCDMRLYMDDELLYKINGSYGAGHWDFLIPELEEGKYEYAFYRDNISLDFHNALYVK